MIDTGLSPADTDSRLPDLILLAKETSSEKRRTLLRELTDHFFGSVPRSSNEDHLYDSVLSDLTAEMEVAVRAELAVRFASASDAPRGLIRRLANDEAQVAGPVLQSSPMLTDEDLLGLARSKGQDHLRAISLRSSIPEALSDVIVARGDNDTLNTLLRNDGAVLSREANETAVERAKSSPALHAATVERKALPADLLNDMYFVVEARLRQQILEQNAAMDPTLLENALAAGRTRVATEDGALPSDYAECLDYVNEMKAAGQLTPIMLAKFLRSGSQTSFLIALSQLADVDFHTASQIVERKELDALAVICKGAELDRALFLTFAVVIIGGGENAMGKAHIYAKLYADLERDAALRTLRFWRMRRTSAAA